MDAADENGGGEIFGAGDDVEEPVDAVAEVDVKVAGLAEHHFGARGSAFGGVAGEIEGAVVGFGLGYGESELGSIREAAHEDLAEELTGDFHCGTVEKAEWKDFMHLP